MNYDFFSQERGIEIVLCSTTNGRRLEKNKSLGISLVEVLKRHTYSHLKRDTIATEFVLLN